MTENEAKTKWCPMVSADDVPEDSDGVRRPRCVGSQCMAWRWREKAGTDDQGLPNYYAGDWQGFCGLAGKP